MSDGKDPYCAMVQAIRKTAGAAAPPGICEGVVLDISPVTLRIRTAAGLELEREDLRVNAALVYTETQQAEISVTNSGSSSAGGMYPGPLTGDFSAQITTQGLRAGDRVALLPSADGQVYYVLCKVVSI